MESDYKWFIDIRFSGGDIQFDVSSESHLFSYTSGIGFVAIPHFFCTLAQLYKKEIKEAHLIGVLANGIVLVFVYFLLLANGLAG
ncbi:hypothetical protein SAMN05518871_102557 [Psychrobacillus sp. OK028]|uniref:hypothetical protein n=1 Tax=Psychrobacillus sp. OK028 TaxID=1884359 RepID=UPI00088DAEC1|nr:hypothetical protein [Psychrobacillus sp. OK028]SDM91627.1 hypothetical protein SAMN05518871_102557 [Psychrobacillus sp. OK028]